ncbi:NAD(P)/FAD-dependent oxidoreductase [Pandoraea communis]|uniref:Sarcosine oxidase subunit beta n=1 Tax=Pandoraea communis TaxID=2508297 RepID=A0A5E4YJK9_9BURK|nr:FAD-binding oxidoreductase [Pandoraea communis]MDM8356692.1 FAD-binding oxidoreductase [Pandoraea communis]VVE48575.1 Sarcosine oxidase subunit beta [Pandoraea communis]
MLRLEEIYDTQDFSGAADVVIIGGGIIGTSTAYELARRGVSVALIEKGVIGGEQSGRNWGWVRQQNRDLFELPLAMRSLRRWGELKDEIQIDLGFRREGILYASNDPNSIAKWEAWGKQARQLGFVSHVLSAAEIRERTPAGGPDYAGGVWSPDDGRAEPSRAAPALAEGAKRLGAQLYQNCAARGLELSGGRISGVWTERGLIKAGAVVCAGGAWSARFCMRHGVQLPAVNVIGTAMRTSVAPNVVNGCFNGPDFALRRRLDGSYTLAIPGYGRIDLAPLGLKNALKYYRNYRNDLGKKLNYRLSKPWFEGPEASASWEFDEISPFERCRVLDPKPDLSFVKTALENLKRAVPEFADVRIVHAWAGAIDTTPDLIPVISEVGTIPGFYIASGFSGHGFALGPAAGELLADMVTGANPMMNIAPYRLGRFSDGSALKVPEMM